MQNFGPNFIQLHGQSTRKGVVPAGGPIEKGLILPLLGLETCSAPHKLCILFAVL